MQPARTLQFASCNFDVSFQEMLTTWCCGGALVLISEPARRDPRLLWRVIVESCVERLFAPYVALAQLAATANGSEAQLRDIISAGEPLQLTPEIRRLVRGLGEVRLHNHYGPTESHVVTSMLLCDELETWPATAPIGRPIANARVYVLDAERHPVPIGVPGELYIGGAGLARGYLNRPELTAEKFVANPFDDDPKSRLYRTGDLCRWRAEGNLEFLGRLDDQVKLRGFRIELGEIESVLNEHPGVSQSVVALREDENRPGDKRLAAYYVSVAGAELGISDLRSHLRTRLPDYMLPAAFVVLDTLPLTSSGKINRRALPAPDNSVPEMESGYVAPGNPIERQLASIWCELLALDRIGVNDDFFELGGHSLLAVRLIARIEKSFGRKLPLAVLFQHGTIGHLANLLVESGPSTEIASALPLQTEGDGRPLFLMPSITGGLLGFRNLIEELGGRFPVIGIQPVLAARNLEHFKDFRTTADCFVRALRAYQPHGPYALAGYSYGGLMAFEVACLLTELGEKVDLLAVLDSGPGRRGLEPPSGDRWRRLSGIAANLPFWMREEFFQFSASQFAGRAARKLRRFYRLMASGGRARIELDDLFNANHIQSPDRELMRAALVAFYDYVPRPYTGKLTLFRAKARPLLSGSSRDLGWDRFAEMLEVRQTNGRHGSILHPPHVGELARQLGELLDDLGS
jgi:thioesterase domain-containing protein/acyl carrier protein